MEAVLGVATDIGPITRYRTVFSVEYFPVRNFIKISRDNNKFQGTPESLEHLQEILSVMRIDVEDINSK